MSEKELKNMQSLQDEVKLVLQRKSGGAASLYVNNTFNFIGEYIFYIIGLGCFVFPFIMKSITPFHILKEITEGDKILTVIPSRGEINTFYIAIVAIIVLCGILFFYIGMNFRTIRKKNSLLHKSFKSLENVNSFLDTQIKSLTPAEPIPFKGELKEIEPKDIKLT